MACIRTALSVFVAIIGIFIYVIHNAQPYRLLECVAFSINCPIAITYGTIDDKNSNRDHLKPIKQIMQNWVRNGYSNGEQLSLFVNHQEILNIVAKDANQHPQFDQTSIMPVFSSSKNFASLAIGIAIQNKWIHSYDDKVIDYWSQFPTKKITIPFEQYIKYYDQYASNMSLLTMETFFEFNKENIVIHPEPHHVRIRDVLRHEGGFCLALSNKEIRLSEITQQELTKMYEDIGYLIYFKESARCYHSFSRGHLLNEIFMRVEPKHRSISTYYKEEIEPTLTSNAPGDNQNEYLLRFDGLQNDKKWIDKYYHIELQPLWWSLYHVLLPMKLGFEKPLNELFAEQLYPAAYVDESWRANASLVYIRNWFVLRKVHWGRYVDFVNANGNPKGFSSQFVKSLNTAHMSASGVGNAHSLAKTMSYILFSGDVFDENMVNTFIAQVETKFDNVLRADIAMSQGGSAKMEIQGIEWYGWGGWGGSVLFFAPRYKAVLSWTVTSFASPHYFYFDAPRQTVILNLVSQQLLVDRAYGAL
eukprot:467236_1